MITFFQKHASKFVWLIIFAFVATLFAGSVFSTLANRQSKKSVSQTSSRIGYYGDNPIDNQQYYAIFRQMIQEFQKPFHTILPETLDLIQYEAFKQALDYSVLKAGAIAKDEKLSRNEKQQIIAQVLTQFDMETKKEFKKFIEEQGGDYKRFMSYQEEQYKVRRFTKSLQEGITATDEDVDRKYSQVNASHILITIPVGEEGRDRAADYILSLQESLQKGESFAELAKEHSQDNTTKEQSGSLGWLQYGQTPASFEDVLYSTEVGAISDPVETPLGIHLIYVQDKQELDRPLDINYELEKDEILKMKQNRAVRTYISTILEGKEIQYKDTLLKGFMARLEGDVETAISAYQTLSSHQPGSPVPDYQIARVYLEAGEIQKATQAFRRGNVKIELNPDTAFSLFYLEWSKVVGPKEKNNMYDNALAVAEEDFTSIRALEKFFKEDTTVKNSQRESYLKKVKKLRKDLEEKVEDLQVESEEIEPIGVKVESNVPTL